MANALRTERSETRRRAKTRESRDEVESGENRVWDVGYDPDAASEYECLDCGELLVARSHPGSCPQCGSTPRNRSMSFE
jgi:rubrerythrin